MVAKAALESVCRYLARDLGSRQIRVNLVAAGPLGTVAARGTHDELLGTSDLYREIVEKGMPDQVFLNRKPVEAEAAGL